MTHTNRLGAPSMHQRVTDVERELIRERERSNALFRRIVELEQRIAKLERQRSPST